MRKHFKFIALAVILLSIAAVTKYKLQNIEGIAPTLTPTELNYVDGVTSNIQTQLNGKGDLATATEATSLFYTKQQSEALKNGNNLLESLQRIGTVMKGVPNGVSINSIMNGTSPLTDGTCYYLMFDVADTVVWTGVDFVLNVAGNYTGDNYNGFALHSVTAAGAITKITETANDANLFKATAYTLGTKAFPTPQTVLPGTYMISTHWNASATTTAPTIYTWGTITSNMGLVMLNGNKVAGYLTSQTATPASTTGTGLTVSSVMPFIFPY